WPRSPPSADTPTSPISTATSADWPRPPRAGGCRKTPSPGAEPPAANPPCREPAAVPICPSPHPPRRFTLEGRRTQRERKCHVEPHHSEHLAHLQIPRRLRRDHIPGGRFRLRSRGEVRERR